MAQPIRSGYWQTLPLLALAGCMPWESVAHDTFQRQYVCGLPASYQVSEGADAPPDPVHVTPDPVREDRFVVEGCGHRASFVCGPVMSGRRGTNRVCVQSVRYLFVASDGEVQTAPYATESFGHPWMETLLPTAREAALASAAHDLPCARGTITVSGSDPNGFANILDGCGQRVTYQVDDRGFRSPEGPVGPVREYRYVLTNRLATGPVANTP